MQSEGRQLYYSTCCYCACLYLIRGGRSVLNVIPWMMFYPCYRNSTDVLHIPIRRQLTVLEASSYLHWGLECLLHSMRTASVRAWGKPLWYVRRPPSLRASHLLLAFFTKSCKKYTAVNATFGFSPAVNWCTVFNVCHRSATPQTTDEKAAKAVTWKAHHYHIPRSQSR